MSKVNNYEWLEFALPSGWIELGYNMIKECEAAEPDFEIIDLKEKWGMIRMYCHPCTDKISEIEHKYEKLSARTCCKCGAPAKWYSTGWILPFCENHINKNEEKFYKKINPLI